MIAFIKGTVASYTADSLVVDHDGMGWEIAYPHTDRVSLNQEIKVYTYLHISENDMRLFGFESQEEKDLFLRLITVKGLGPKTAMNMLSKAGYDSIFGWIEEGNVNALKKMPGIGAKSASQIVLDLKGKLVAPADATTRKTVPASAYPKEIEDALEGLKNLGYQPRELNGVGDYMNTQPGLKTENYLRIGLRYLMKQKLGG